MDELTNEDRAELGRVALDAFGMRTGQRDYDYRDGEEFLEIAGDLVANLMHAARLAGVDPDEMVSRGLFHFEAEEQEEQDEEPPRND